MNSRWVAVAYRVTNGTVVGTNLQGLVATAVRVAVALLWYVKTVDARSGSNCSS